jgi:anti-anti-sigma regulatory factor
MNLSCTESGECLVMTLDGELDESSASALPGKLSHLCGDKSQKHIILDLKRCRIEGALAYGALVAFRLSPVILKKQVSIQNALPTVQKGMQALRFDKLFDLE